MQEALSFGSWLKQQRRLLDLTQQELAQRAACSLSTLRKIESDDLLPSRELAQLLAVALAVPAAEQAAFIAFARDERRSALSATFAMAPTASVRPPVTSPVLTALPPTAPSPQLPRRTLPTQLTPFIGRDTEVLAVQQMLANPDCALLTIVGPGGIGKTRLALEAARRIADSHVADGVYFVSFAGVTTPDFMVSTIANAIGFAFAGSGDPQTQLFNYLSAKALLLVLDNLEHLLAGVELLVELLQAAPAVKLLATSRERLAVEGEWVFDLPALIAPLSPQGGDGPIITDLHHYPAVTLFVERAQRTDHNFALSAENGGDVAQICRLVGGMPLALELAAGWVHTLSCAEIAGEIARNLDFLAVTRRDLPARQRSVRATFDHSWQLLSADEQQVLRRLAVFRGGFQREAAASVAGASLPLLASLVTKSLLQRTAEGRYDLHELVRQYAADHLQRDPQEETKTRHAHAEHFLGTLDDRTGLFNQQHAAARKTLLRDSENLRVAWQWAAASGRYDLLRRATPTFWYFHELCFLLHEGEALFAQALQTVAAQTPPAMTVALHQVLQGDLQARQGWFQSRIGHLTAAEPLLAQALITLRQQNDQAALADLLHHFSTLERYRGSFDQGQAYAREALALNRTLDRPWWTAMCLHVLGNNIGVQGFHAEALGCYTEALTILRTLGEPRATATLLASLSQVTRALGQITETKALLQEALTLATQVEDTATVAFLYEQMGITAARAQEHAEAQQFLQRAIDLFGERSDAWHSAFALNWSGWIYVESAEEMQAQARFVDALRLSNEANFIPNAICSLVGLATVHAKTAATAVQLAIAHYALAHPASTHETKAYAQQLQMLVEGQLGPQQIEAARMQAQATTLAALAVAINQ